jgi:hypothetical protein
LFNIPTKDFCQAFLWKYKIAQVAVKWKEILNRLTPLRLLPPSKGVAIHTYFAKPVILSPVGGGDGLWDNGYLNLKSSNGTILSFPYSVIAHLYGALPYFFGFEYPGVQSGRTDKLPTSFLLDFSSRKESTAR